jgi:hypothetical protein
VARARGPSRSCLRVHRQRRFVRPAPRRVGLKAVIFVPEFAPEPKVAQLLVSARDPRRGHVRRDVEMCQRACDAYGWYNQRP